MNSTETVPLTAADLDPAAWACLLMRAETRAWRLQAVGRHARRNAYDLAAELKLTLPVADAARVRGWLAWIHQEIEAVERALAGLVKLRDFILVYEPEGDAWVRRQLDGLEQPDGAKLWGRPYNCQGRDSSGCDLGLGEDDDGDDDQPAVALRG